MGGAPLDFYFDFSSPYGYLASHRIDELAARHGRDVEWRPITLGVVFKITGAVPHVQVPLKGDYVRRDWARASRRLGVPFTLPQKFPFPSGPAVRAYYWLRDQDAAKARALAKAVFHAAFAEGRAISAADDVAALGEKVDVAPHTLMAGIADPESDERVKNEVDTAIARGVFGSPFIIVDGEPFFGGDRLDEVDAWLKSGGW
ncbi:MAG: 2-hydroxychromene-2-carboxylate isomerase [Myxococcota bacterium]